MGALSSTQSSNSNQTTKMKSLLVCFSVVAVALAAEEAPAAVLPALGYPYAAYPYAYGHGALAPAAYTIPSPVQYKYVPKDVEIEVKTYQPELIETGCANIFGTPVPCHQEGEARKRRSAEEVIPSPQQYQPANGQQPDGQGSKLALLAFPPELNFCPAVGHCSAVSAQLRLSPQQTQSAASQQPDGQGGFVAASLTPC